MDRIEFIVSSLKLPDSYSFLNLALLRRSSWKGIALLMALFLIGGSVPRSLPTRAQIIKSAVDLPDFNFFAWELNALGSAVFGDESPLKDGLEEDAQVGLVRAYFERATLISEKEVELDGLVSEEATATTGDAESETVQVTDQAKQWEGPAGDYTSVPGRGMMIEEARLELAGLRRRQSADRSLVEAILQNQIREEIREADLGLLGFVWPPVQFAFIEPPLKLTVSPRDRISTLHSRVLQADYDPVTLEESEHTIEAHTGLSAHISQIGGMAVFPAMVVESSSLKWVLETVAHEWAHHYLFLFPLGLRYASSDEATTINETVAEIVGVEIGERVWRRLYDTSAPSADPAAGSNDDMPCACSTADLWALTYEMEQSRWERYGRPLAFDFRREMRETRLHVDRLLKAGHVETAETYMEGRRRYFVAQGYPLRVLNQAYFAFNGNYGTGAASSNPIGPMLEQLREESDSLAHFFGQVRWFTSMADLEKALQANGE
ncbi:MAG: hypothetical protein OXF50_21955 [Caldilineaceae bacterium]|nr:hypothetical protein [Caldilineaceae bacterium]